MNGRFEVVETPLPGLTVLHRKRIGDERGFIERMFCADELGPYFPATGIRQINRMVTAHSGTVRGMHFQYPPFAETKIITCLEGAVFDVVVDIRNGSPTFLRWHGEILRATECRTVIVPEGFAHGFQTLTPDATMLYFAAAPYRPEAEGGLRVDDPRLAIDWPLPISRLSERDLSLPPLPDDFDGVRL